MQDDRTLTDAEMRATLYFAVGVTSESGDRAYRLVVAGDRLSTPLLEPADNSGYSIGTIQTDLGQHYQPENPQGENVPRDLIQAYQAWAQSNSPEAMLTEEQAAQAISDLGRNGRQIKAEGGRPMDAVVQGRLDTFLQTDAGISWVHGRDVAQIDKLMQRAMPPLVQSDLYRQATPEDQVRLVAMVGKAYNQNERRSETLLEGLRANSYADPEALSRAIDGLSARTGDYFEAGRDKALRGADVVNALRAASPESPIAGTWATARDNALTNPTQFAQQTDGEQAAHAYNTVRTLFVEYDRAVPFVQAIDRGSFYAWGRPQEEGRERATAGLYASGDDFAVWNRQGKGHAYVGGQWSDVQRDELTRTRNRDGTTDLDRSSPDGTSERLLHVDPARPPLRASNEQPAQSQSGRDPIEGFGAFDPLLQQAERAVRQLDQNVGREYDSSSACLAASAACLARRNGLTGIDHVVLSQDSGRVKAGELMFVVQGGLTDPAHQRAWMRTDEAVRTPIAQSLEELERLNREQPQPGLTPSLDEAQHHMQAGPQR